jgi:hypothetical protein
VVSSSCCRLLPHAVAFFLTLRHLPHNVSRCGNVAFFLTLRHLPHDVSRCGIFLMMSLSSSLCGIFLMLSPSSSRCGIFLTLRHPHYSPLIIIIFLPKENIL